VLHYSDLSKEQKESICNGCGGKGGFINPPEFLFHASCNQHDFYYWRGGDEIDRKKADDAFYRFMQIDCTNEDRFIKRHLYEINAWLYYKAVRVFGKKFFNYGKQKTKEDLLRLAL